MDVYIDNKTAQQMVDPERFFQPVTSKCELCGTEWPGEAKDECPVCKGLDEKIVSYLNTLLNTIRSKEHD